MTLSASVLLLAQLAAAPPAPVVPSVLVARVEEAVGMRWSVPVAALELAWGMLPAIRDDDLESPLRLGPISRDGWFAVTIDPATSAPRAFRVRAGVLASQPTAARALATGTRLEVEDIRWMNRVRWGPPDTTQALVEPGWEVRRAVQAGELLAGVVVAPPVAVGTGESFRIFWRRQGVEIELEAVALTAARIGERVQARTSTGRLTARMTGMGIAQIEGGVP